MREAARTLMLLDVDQPSHDAREVERIVEGEERIERAEGVPLHPIGQYPSDTRARGLCSRCSRTSRSTAQWSSSEGSRPYLKNI